MRLLDAHTLSISMSLSVAMAFRIRERGGERCASISTQHSDYKFTHVTNDAEDDADDKDKDKPNHFPLQRHI